MLSKAAFFTHLNFKLLFDPLLSSLFPLNFTSLFTVTSLLTIGLIVTALLLILSLHNSLFPVISAVVPSVGYKKLKETICCREFVALSTGSTAPPSSKRQTLLEMRM